MSEAQEQQPSVYKSSVGRPRPLEAVLDGGDRANSIMDAMLQIEVWVKSDSGTDFEIHGSRDEEDWRYLDTLTALPPDNFIVHTGFPCPYRYLRVQTERVGEHEIEIVGAW